MHGLQCSKQLDWDQELDKDKRREWVNIAKQANLPHLSQLKDLLVREMMITS